MESLVNGIHQLNGHNDVVPGLPGDPSQEELERELPFVEDDQVHLGDLLSRVAQDIYAELTELAETLVFESTAQALELMTLPGFQTCRMLRESEQLRTGL